MLYHNLLMFRLEIPVNCEILHQVRAYLNLTLRLPAGASVQHYSN